jgi:hypothetical protein
MVYHQRIYTLHHFTIFESCQPSQVSTSPAQLFIERCKAETTRFISDVKAKGLKWTTHFPWMAIWGTTTGVPTRFRLSVSCSTPKSVLHGCGLQSVCIELAFDSRCVRSPLEDIYIRPDIAIRIIGCVQPMVTSPSRVSPIYAMKGRPACGRS